MPQTVIALVEDLMFIAKLRLAAQETGAALQVTHDAEELLRLARSGAPTLLLLDLNFGRADALALAAQLHAVVGPRGIPIAGFLSHVQAERAQQALHAGCAAALARSAFVQHLPALLRDGLAALPPALLPPPSPAA